MRTTPRHIYMRRCAMLLLPCVLLLAGVASLGARAAVAAGAHAPVAQTPLTLALTMTVSTSPDCIGSDQLTVKLGDSVTICYQMVNTTTITFSNHFIADSAGLPATKTYTDTVAPNQSMGITVNFTATTTSVRNDKWVANNVTGPEQAIGTDSVTITVLDPALSVKQTLSTSPSACTADTSIAVAAGTLVYRCLTLTNTGNVDLTKHAIATSTTAGTSAAYTLTQTIAAGKSLVLTTANPAGLDSAALQFSPAVAQTSKVVVESQTAAPEAFRSVPAESSAGVTVGTAKTTLGGSVSVATTCGPATATSINVLTDTPVYFCLRLGNSGNTTLTQHVIGMTGQAPVTYMAVLEPSATLVITTGTLTAVGLSPILGPVTATSNINTTFVVTSTVAGGFRAVSTATTSVLASTPTRTPTTTPTPLPTSTLWPTWTPFPVAPTWTTWPTWTPTDTPIPPSPTWTRSFELSNLQTPTPRADAGLAPGAVVDYQATAIALGDPNAYLTPNPNGVPPFDSGLPTPFIDPNQPEQAGVTQPFTDTWTPTPSATPTIEPTRTPLPTQTPSSTPSPTATQRPIVYAQPVPPPTFGGLFATVLDSTIAAAGVLFVTTGAVIFFAVLGLVLGIGFLRAGRRRFDLEELDGEDSDFIASLPPSDVNSGASEDRWPTSLP